MKDGKCGLRIKAQILFVVGSLKLRKDVGDWFGSVLGTRRSDSRARSNLLQIKYLVAGHLGYRKV